MTRNRWYPTNTTLNNGDVLTTAGETEPTQLLANDQRFPELWHSGNWTSLSGVLRGAAPNYAPFPTYPWTFAAPNGKVFYAGPDPYIGYIDPAGSSPPLPGSSSTAPRVGAWVPTDGQARNYYGRGQGTAAMFWPGKILLVGGANGQTVTNTTEIIDLTSGNLNQTTGYIQPVVTPAAPMRNVRHHVNSTILPDGTVLVTGGSRITSASDPNQGVLDAEIWTPPAPNASGTPGAGPGTWTTVAPMKEARMYHSTAVLLPDGRVLSAGGEEDIKYDPAFVPNVNNHCTAEIYSPPYLFDANGNARVRPVISYAPALASYGQPFAFDSPDAASIDQVTWIRLSSVTHSFNMNQRFLRLSITGRSATSVTATAPSSANDCPPGHYLVFALRNGVPSEAKIVAIGNNPCGATLNITTSRTSTPCGVAARATVGGTNLGAAANYHWYIDGNYEDSYDGMTGLSIYLSHCRPQVTFAVEVIPACGGPALTSSQSVSAAPFNPGAPICDCE